MWIKLRCQRVNHVHSSILYVFKLFIVENGVQVESFSGWQFAAEP